MKGYSPRTVALHRFHLQHFFVWCQERSIARPTEVTRDLLQRYQRRLFLHRKPDGEPLSIQTRNMKLSTVQLLFRWMVKEGLLLTDPSQHLEHAKVGFRLPKKVLTHVEVEQVMAKPDITKTLGLRDRALMETLYGSAIRRAELVSLKVEDIDLTQGLLYVRQGKGGKDRVVPLGERAIAWLRKYIEDAREKLLEDPGEQTLFLTRYGGGFNTGSLTQLVRAYLDGTVGNGRGACHALRHAAATAMLENGADIRFIQVFLGHAHVTSTEVYAHVAITKLKEVYDRTHPSAQLARAPEEKPVPDPRALLEEMLADDEDG